MTNNLMAACSFKRDQDAHNKEAQRKVKGGCAAVVVAQCWMNLLSSQQSDLEDAMNMVSDSFLASKRQKKWAEA